MQTKQDISKQRKEMTWKHTNNRMQKKPNDFGLKYDNQKPKRKG